MKPRPTLTSMSTDELFKLDEQLVRILSERIIGEKRKLQRRLATLDRNAHQRQPIRRSYPPVLPKFADPKEPTRRWSGRGKTPRWVAEKLAGGLSLNDLRINRVRARRA